MFYTLSYYRPTELVAHLATSMPPLALAINSTQTLISLRFGRTATEAKIPDFEGNEQLTYLCQDLRSACLISGVQE